MILTGKCREDFIKTKIGNEIKLFESMLPIYRNTLIIEWFDSVGIYIMPEICSIKGIFTATIFHEKYRTKTGRTISEIENFNSRQEALIEAIKKANEIYNEKYSISQ